MIRKVSVLMPCYNNVSTPRAHFNFWAAIESICNQDYENWELIAVNDGSTDDTGTVLDDIASEKKRVKVVHLPKNSGIGAALNAAAATATGEYLARMDSDDMSVVYRLATQARILDDNPEIGITGSGMWVIDDNDHIIMEIVRPSLHEDILRFCIGHGCPFVHGSVMMRRHVFEDVGGYADRSEWSCEDFELWFRILSTFRGHNFPEPMYFYRHLTQALSKQNAERIARDTSRVIEMFHKRFVDVLYDGTKPA